MYLFCLGTFPEPMVKQQQQHIVSWLGWWVEWCGGWGGPNHYVDTPTRVEVELG
jgi:hypothetical protein